MENQRDTRSVPADQIDPSPKKTHQKTVSLRLNPWWLSVLLLAGLITVLLLWKPWDGAIRADRTVTVTGSTTIKAEPNEFVFTPSYEFKNTDKQTALNDSIAKSKEVVAGLKALGVADKNIKTRTSGYNYDYWYDDKENTYRYGLSPEVTVSTREMAQKVEDYLVKTEPMGMVSPEAKFSRDKLRELESKARTEATKDARTKADEMAKNIGFRVAKVKSIDDSTVQDVWGGMRMPLASSGSAAAKENGDLAVQPGEDEFDYTVTVIYYIR